jgi:hypothetical protein
MGKGRSPLLGYNHNVRYRGRIYHVQTEDSGPANPRIFTHLFFEGTILGSRRQDYDATAPDDLVRALMQQTHKSILKELKQSLYDEKIRAFFARRNQEAFLDSAGDAGAELADPGLATPAPATRGDATLEMAAPPVHEPDPIPAPVVMLSPRGVTGVRRVLDLDALPPEPPPADPEPLAPFADLAPPEAQLPVPAPPRGAIPPGPGVYSMRGGQQERPFGHERGPAPTERATPVSSATTPVDDPIKPPVVVIRPPAERRPPRTPAPQPAPPGGVVVQRTVVVGAGNPGPAPFQARPRRPRPAVPYVVKEGSHPIVPNSARVAPPVPGGQRSPTPSPVPTQQTVPNSAPGAAISDRSLDEVILAYLSQEDER